MDKEQFVVIKHRSHTHNSYLTRLLLTNIMCTKDKIFNIQILKSSVPGKSSRVVWTATYHKIRKKAGPDNFNSKKL